MTSITLSEREKAERQFSQTRCFTCQFPAGKVTNKITGEVVRVFFYKAAGGKYVCNRCVESGRGIRVAKWDKKSRKAMKKLMKGG